MSRCEDGATLTCVRRNTMTGEYDNANGAHYTPLELLVMELFRTISPNGGSISTIQDARTTAYGASPHQRFSLPFERNSYISTPHTSTSFDPTHWKDPKQFDPKRYLDVPTSAEVEGQMPADRSPAARSTSRPLRSERPQNELNNSGFSTVFGVWTATRYRSATMPASRRLASASPAVLASSDIRCSRSFCARCGVTNRFWLNLPDRRGRSVERGD